MLSLLSSTQAESGFQKLTSRPRDDICLTTLGRLGLLLSRIASGEALADSCDGLEDTSKITASVGGQSRKSATTRISQHADSDKRGEEALNQLVC